MITHRGLNHLLPYIPSSYRPLAVGLALLVRCGAPPSPPDEIVVNDQVFDLVAVPADVAPMAASIDPDAPLVVRDLVLGDEELIPLHEWDRTELAEALRPTIVDRGGGVYTAREPAWQAADAIIAAQGDPGVEELIEWIPGDRGPARGDPVGVRALERADDAIIWGSDNRVYVSNTTVHPRRANVRLEILVNGVPSFQCTGAYIGPWTLLTAAHCIRNPNGSMNNGITFKPAQNGSTLPYGQFTCRNDDGPTSNDILISLPTGNPWTNPALDYAVIDTYPCHVTPTRYDGLAANSGAGTYSVYGYPGTPACAGAPGANNYQCGMSGYAYDNGAYLETQTIDLDNGQSGAGWSTNPNGAINYVHGTQSGYFEYFDFWRCGFDPCKRNFARRIDNTYKLFIQWWS